ncbi:MAG: bifunctional demethylmenaquinone methyltransferase/2-methoxy-6-polyprenyl-1,4-benzoquinol methylase UbiE [Bacteroidetes bacterium]|nr:bifunctional demethylmenaquinone methyltransferase/2-methoxy-6-polyprenyl-1,4-benzoquinol methylase UbiE [Bacteroidota bacterium]
MSREVHDMFAEISGSYDRANSVLSLGVHHRWRQATVRHSAVQQGDRVLDCATGTGDLALEFKRTVGAEGRVVGTDFCAEMLAFAPAKAEHAGLAVEWEVQDAMQLSYPDDTFDVASIAFGIRNVDDPMQALRSMGRVVRPGGRVMVLEFGRPLWWMKPFFSFYSRVIIPLVGGLVSGKRDAYEYLTRTSAAFPTGDEFLALMDQSGMYSERRTIPLTGGIAYLYIGTVK